MNRVSGIVAFLIPRTYSLASTESEKNSFLDMICVLTSMTVLLVLDNTKLMITFHFVMIGTYILSYVTQKAKWLLLNMLPVYVAFVLVETFLILIPNGILALVTVLAKHDRSNVLSSQYDFSLLIEVLMKLGIYIVPFFVVGLLTSKIASKRENYYIHYLGLLVMTFFLVSGNGFEYLVDSSSIISTFILKLHSFILWFLGFIPIGTILGQFAYFGITILERLLSDGNVFLELASSIYSFVCPILDSITTSTLFQWLAIYFIQWMGSFFLKYAYDHGPTHHKLIRLFIPTYGLNSSESTVRYPKYNRKLSGSTIRYR